MTRPTALIVAIACVLAGCGPSGRGAGYDLPVDPYTDGYLTARDSCLVEMGAQRPVLFSSSIRDTFIHYDGGLWKRVPR